MVMDALVDFRLDNLFKKRHPTLRNSCVYQTISSPAALVGADFRRIYATGLLCLAEHHIQREILGWSHARGPTRTIRRHQLVAGTGWLDFDLLSPTAGRLGQCAANIQAGDSNGDSTRDR